VPVERLSNRLTTTRVLTVAFKTVTMVLSHTQLRQWFGLWLFSSSMTPTAALHLAMSSSSFSSSSKSSNINNNLNNNNINSNSNWKPPAHWTFTGFRHKSGAGIISSKKRSSTSINSAFDDDDEDFLSSYYDDTEPRANAIYPDGGLSPCVIKVIGVGGGGSNAVDRMLDTAVGGVDFWAINTDAQALGRSKAKGAKVLNIGASVTRGLGAGGNPDIGRMAVCYRISNDCVCCNAVIVQSNVLPRHHCPSFKLETILFSCRKAEESLHEIEAMVAGTDLCFITSGMGGGTGSGACPVVAQVAKEQGCLTVGIVTKPFAFEGKRRMKQAIAAIERLRENVDTVIIVSNDRLLEIIPDDTPIERAFAVADDILRQGVVGISDIIVKPGLINVDFADVRSIMRGAGTALMGIGIGSGKTAAEDAAAAAISSPLLDSTIENAKGVVFNISGGPNLSLNEVNQAAKLIYSTVEADANVIFGALVDDTLEDNISITVLATGFESSDGQLEAIARRNKDVKQSTSRQEEPAFNDVRAEQSTKKRAPVNSKQAAQPATAGKPIPAPRSSKPAGGPGADKLPSFLKSLKKK